MSPDSLRIRELRVGGIRIVLREAGEQGLLPVAAHSAGAAAAGKTRRLDVTGPRHSNPVHVPVRLAQQPLHAVWAHLAHPVPPPSRDDLELTSHRRE